MNIRDIRDLHLDVNNAVELRTEIVLWDGKHHIELVVEGIDFARGQAGTIVLVGKGWVFAEDEKYPTSDKTKALEEAALALKVENRIHRYIDEHYKEG